MELPNFNSRVFLAPMAGISDPAFRLICHEHGAGLTFTELTSIHSVVALKGDLKKIIPFDSREKPRAIQLFGSDIDLLSKAAKIVEPFFDIIDYNMGCPAPHITNSMAGAALLQKRDLTKKIFHALVSSVNIPVSLKMRSGINNKNNHLFLDIAKIAEEEGISMITLHARTLEQGYSGSADWSLIKELKDSVNIPVVGNGDISSPETAKKMIDETGCDFVMIGRAARGNPFLFEQINDFLDRGVYMKSSFEDKFSAFFQYLDYTKSFKIKFANIRIQAMNFTKEIVGGRKMRANLSMAKSITEIKMILENYKKSA